MPSDAVDRVHRLYTALEKSGDNACTKVCNIISWYNGLRFELSPTGGCALQKDFNMFGKKQNNQVSFAHL